MTSQFLFDPKFKTNSPTDMAQIAMLESIIGRSLPSQYRNFLAVSNGGVGALGPKGYIDLWSVARILETMKNFTPLKFQPEFLAVGSDGGSEMVVIKYTGNEVIFGYMPFADFKAENFVELGNDFKSSLESIAMGSEFT